MPVIPNTSNYPTDRRASGNTKSDISKSKWPVITRTAYNSVMRTPDKDMTLKMRRLCMAKIRIGQAMLALADAMHDANPKVKAQSPELYNRLRSVDKKISDALAQFPLEVV
jgi:hypothetical protein